MEPMTGFEPVTSSLPRKHSTTELHRPTESGRRASNSRPTAWKAVALPTELLPLLLYKDANLTLFCTKFASSDQAYIIDLWGEQDSNLRSHKTTDLQSVPVGRFGIPRTGI